MTTCAIPLSAVTPGFPRKVDRPPQMRHTTLGAWACAVPEVARQLRWGASFGRQVGISEVRRKNGRIH